MKTSLIPSSVFVLILVFILGYTALANEPPRASFTYFPAHPDTLDEVQFLDTSTDPDSI